ncbi:MAG: hypothetical protein ACLTDI_07825 [Acutalibacteraceae bacterium]
MRSEKMLAALLAGLIILSLTGCGADKAENTSSDPATTKSGITATVTESTAEPTAESSLPAGTESTTKSTAEKERAGSTAPADSGKKETAKPADAESPNAPPKQTEPPKVTEPPKQTEPPKVTEPSTKTTEPQPTEPPATKQPKGFTEADHTRIVSEVKTYAESYTAKGFTFEWAEELAFGWDVGWMGTPRISRDGIDGVISTLKHHVDLIYKSGTDPANGVTANSVRYKVVQLEIDGGIAYAVIYG